MTSLKSDDGANALLEEASVGDADASNQRVLNRGAVAAGLAMMALGLAAATAGAGVVALAGAAAVRGRWNQYQDLPEALSPSELALHHWKRAKTAGLAGLDTWRSGPADLSVE
jgi:hypothetical protein